MFDSTINIQADIEAINKLNFIPTLLEIVCRTTGMGFAAVARVTEDKWVACSVRDEIAFGLAAGGELKLETTICNEIRQHHNPVIIDEVAKDEAFANHHTPAMYGFQSYISIPIMLKNGDFFGTLCAIDPKPAQLNNTTTIGMFTMYADLISFHLGALDELAFSEKKLLQQGEDAELREQFIAILGHDLRNPVSAVTSGADLLLRMPVSDETKTIAGSIRNSAFHMTGLIENIMDFSSGRLGSGITLELKNNAGLDKMLLQVIQEIEAVNPGKIVETTISLTEPVLSDSNRIAQLFSNLLSNAAAYGAADTPIKVVATSGNGIFELAVSNAGEKIADAAIPRLFQPFSRGDVKPGQKGLGLGLFISAEIAHAHGGQINVISNETETCFTLQMPSRKPRP